VVKDKKRRLEYRARREAADENTTINHGCWQGEAGQQAAQRRRRAGRMTRQSTDGGGGHAGTTGRWWGYVGGASVATRRGRDGWGIPADAAIWYIGYL